MKKQKGQDLIEYALMLALVVGIGGFIYTQGHGANISGVFNNAGNMLEQANKTQEEAKEEAARNADRSYADRMAELLKNAIQSGQLTMRDGTTIYLLAQNKTPSNANGFNYNVNAAVYGPEGGWKNTAWVDGRDYGSMGYNNFWRAIGEGTYQDAAVNQSNIDWYGVGITQNKDGTYNLSYVEGKGYNGNNGFNPRSGTEYKNETWSKMKPGQNPKDALIHS